MVKMHKNWEPFKDFLKSKIPSTKSQTNHKLQIPNRFKAIVFLFGILNFGHCNLFVFWNFH